MQKIHYVPIIKYITEHLPRDQVTKMNYENSDMSEWKTLLRTVCLNTSNKLYIMRSLSLLNEEKYITVCLSASNKMYYEKSVLVQLIKCITKSLPLRKVQVIKIYYYLL